MLTFHLTSHLVNLGLTQVLILGYKLKIHYVCSDVCYLRTKILGVVTNSSLGSWL